MSAKFTPIPPSLADIGNRVSTFWAIFPCLGISKRIVVTRTQGHAGWV